MKHHFQRKPHSQAPVPAPLLVNDDGTYTPGTASTHVGAEWHVMPGDQITVEYINALPDDEFTAVGQTNPETVAQPINLHTHGVTVRPDGNSDNVLLSIPQGRSNEYVIDIPADQHAGLYWYHPHVHGNSDAQSTGSIAHGDRNGDGHDDLIVSRGPGGSRVVVLDATNGGRLSDFNAYDDKAINGVDVAADIFEFGGRVSLVTGTGPGGALTANAHNFDLFGDANETMADLHAAGALKPLLVAGANGAYRGASRRAPTTRLPPLAGSHRCSSPPAADPWSCAPSPSAATTSTRSPPPGPSSPTTTSPARRA